jgi:hypothetical protein
VYAAMQDDLDEGIGRLLARLFVRNRSLRRFLDRVVFNP